MHVDDAIRSRKSARRFLPTPVPAATVRHILQVSARAPSGNNVQPWRVYAVAGEPRQRLCDAIVLAATTDPDRHQPEYAYYPTQWVEPYLDRRRRCGFDRRRGCATRCRLRRGRRLLSAARGNSGQGGEGEAHKISCESGAGDPNEVHRRRQLHPGRTIRCKTCFVLRNVNPAKALTSNAKSDKRRAIPPPNSRSAPAGVQGS